MPPQALMRWAPLLLAAAGLALLVVGVVATGARSEQRRQGTNHVRPLVESVVVAPGRRMCQPAENVPAGTGAIRLWAGTGGRPGPRLAVTVDGDHRGELAAGWLEGIVAVPVEVGEDRRDVEVCIANRGEAAVSLAGEAFPDGQSARVGGVAQTGRARIVYLRPGAETWWAIAPAVRQRIVAVRGSAPGGLTPYLWAVLAVAALAGALLVVLRRPRRVAGAVALLTTVNALAWGLLVPPFHVPDEPSHAFYAQYLSETGRLPEVSGDTDWYAGDINHALAASGFWAVAFEPVGRPQWHTDFAPVRVAGEAPEDRVGTGNAASASSNPPLYYLAQAPVYLAARGLDVTDRLALMRVLSALMAGLTALCVYGFLRELVGGGRLPAVVGAVLAGLMPMFAFISSGVNNDAGLYLASSALLLVLARILRRGLTVRRALAAGALVGGGLLVKTQVLAFAPAVALALVVGAYRARALKPVAVAVLAACTPVALYGLLGATVWKRPLLDRADALSAPDPASPMFTGTFGEQLSYTWQEYLPRLPWMEDLVPGIQPWSLWFKGLVGNFGWLDYGYPEWAYLVALALVAATAAVVAGLAWRDRGALRERMAEIGVLGLFAIGLAVAVAAVSYRARVSTGLPFDQGRYLLPLLGLFALLPALAVRAAGPRLAPVLGVVLVLGVLAYSVFAQLLTVARYYG